MSFAPPTRWYFTGNAGSGKSTYAAKVASHLGVPRHELDATYHQPNWTPLPTDEFRSRVRSFVAEDGWTIDGNYRDVRSIILRRAQVVVAFDLPKALVMRQVVARTLRRRWHRQELWNGNRESIRNMVRLDPERNIILWSFTTHHKVHLRTNWFERVAHDLGITFLRVRSHDEARDKIASTLGLSPQDF